MATSAALRAVKVSAAAVDRVWPRRRGIVFLLYHRVGGASGLQVDLPADLFDRQMEALAGQGRPRSIDQALSELDGAPPAGPDPVVVTFDDGTADFADVALPILERHRVPAVIYVATDFVERRRSFPHDGSPLSWGSLADAGTTGLVTVGCHTHTHPILHGMPPEAVARELDVSASLIEDRLGTRATHFAYPKAVPASAGAEAVVRDRFRSAALAGTRANPYGCDPYRLARSPIQVADGMDWFHRKAAGGMALEGTLRRLRDRVQYARVP